MEWMLYGSNCGLDDVNCYLWDNRIKNENVCWQQTKISLQLMCLFFAKVKVIGESIRLSVLEQPLRICDSLCKNRILDFQVVPNVTTVFENHRKSLIRHCQNWNIQLRHFRKFLNTALDPISCSTISNAREHLLAQMTKAKSLLFLQKKKVC